MAAFAMNYVENQMCSSPLFYSRYVDDICAIFAKKEEADMFLEQINKISPHIQFTMESEENGKLVFLDVELIKSTSHIDTKWHKKSTNTGLYLKKQAYSPQSYKNAAMKSLFYRAIKLCSNEKLLDESFTEIIVLFISNGYNLKYIDKIKNEVLKKTALKKDETVSDEKIIYWKLPFISQMVKENKEILKKLNHFTQPYAKIRIAYNTIKSANFFFNKDKVSDSVKSRVIYQYTCDQCSDAIYTGETIRHFDTRKKEHTMGCPTPTEVSLHEHAPKSTNFKIITINKYTKIGEALIYNTVPENRRLNKYRPPFELQLFNYTQTNIIQSND